VQLAAEEQRRKTVAERQRKGLLDGGLGDGPA
jgi:hypothetical protein